MPGPRRGALPLVLLIVAVLIAGIVFAVMRQPEGDDRAGPTPTAPPPDTPAPPPDDETPPPPDDETPPPPDGETPPPTDDETPPPRDGETPPPDETPGPGVAGPVDEGPGAERPPLAETGGPVLPFLGMGSLLVALSAALWRFSRPR